MHGKAAKHNQEVEVVSFSDKSVCVKFLQGDLKENTDRVKYHQLKKPRLSGEAGSDVAKCSADAVAPHGASSGVSQGTEKALAIFGKLPDEDA